MRLLKADEIEVKVKQCTEKGAIALLYKTARVDMSILDEEFTPLGWTSDYKEIKGNLYCGIGVKDKDGFVWKWDCGIESREDSEGNEKKGEASDAFKRAGFKWGIGRELYSAPFTFLKVETEKKGDKWQLKDRFVSFEVDYIEYQNDKISKLSIKDSNGNIVYSYGMAKQQRKEEPKESAAEYLTNLVNEIKPKEEDNEEEEIYRQDLISELQFLGANLSDVAAYYKTKSEQLTIEQLKDAISKKKGKNERQK